MAEKTYKNISNAPVLGNLPGKVFTADIPNDQLKRMIARHSIKEVDPSEIIETPEEEATDEAADTGDGDGKDKQGDGDKQGQHTPSLTPPSPLGKKGN